MKHYTLPLRIEHDDRNLRVSFGDTVLLDTAPTTEPDRITITLTEREAELVYELGNRAVSPGDMYRIFDALYQRGLRQGECAFELDGFEKRQTYGCERQGYAHAERVQPGLSGAAACIRLTMDRDVAVTLRSLIERVSPVFGTDLMPVFMKLVDAGVGLVPPRFTGTIKWKKRRLKTYELTPGKTYRLLGDNRAMDVYEWEPVE